MVARMEVEGLRTNETAASDDGIMEGRGEEARCTLACQPNDHIWWAHQDLANRLDPRRRPRTGTALRLGKLTTFR